MGIKPGRVIFLLLQCASTLGMAATYSASDQATLKTAIDNANASGTSDTINLTANIVIDGTLPGSPFVADGDNGMPSITTAQPLLIDGHGFFVQRSSIAPSFRFFHLALGTSVTFRNITLKSGLAVNPSGDAAGGAIYNLGALTIEDSTFDLNQASGSNQPSSTASRGLGGAIFHGNGSLSIARTAFTNNSALGRSITFGGGPANDGFGGAIYATAPATVGDITASTFTANAATGGSSGQTKGFGGALAMVGVLANSINNSLFSANIATGGLSSQAQGSRGGDGGGGAIYQEDGTTADISFSTFDINQAVGGLINTGARAGGAAFGGGIYLQTSSITVLRNSTLSGNQANGKAGLAISSGGGLFLTGSTLSMNNSTVSGNNTNDSGDPINSQGGGIKITGASDLILIANTITNNSAGDEIGGGGIYIEFPATISELTSNIVAKNSDGGDAAGQDIVDDSLVPPINIGALTIAAANNNLVGVDLYSGLVNGVNGNIVGTVSSPVDPMIGPLADNGGPTKTHALLATSPAVNVGANPINATFDQRGAGFLREVPPGEPDMGAFEIQGSNPPSNPGRRRHRGGGGAAYVAPPPFLAPAPMPVLGPVDPVVPVVQALPVGMDAVVAVEEKAMMPEPVLEPSTEGQGYRSEGGCSAAGSPTSLSLLLAMLILRLKQRRTKS